MTRDPKLLDDALTFLYNACHPRIAATEEQYLDLEDVRGGGAFTRHFCRQLQRSLPSTATHYECHLFTGHQGSGKSSELQCLSRELEKGVGQRRILPVYMDAEEYLDRNDVHIFDILFATVAEVGAALKDKTNIKLKDSYFQARLNEMKTIFFSEVEPTEAEWNLGVFKSKFKIIKTSHNARKEVREALRPHENSLLTEINLLLDRARTLLREQTPYSDFALILDNLEKIRKVSGKEEGDDSLEHLFVGASNQLGGLAAHTVLTLPLSLARSHVGGEWRNLYGCEPFSLPMVKTRRRKEYKPYEKGYAKLKELLQKRLDLMPRSQGLRWEEVFEDAATNTLIEFSGGDVRTLMYYIQEAITEEDKAPITQKSARIALRASKRTFDASIAHWDKLAKLEQSADQKIPNDDAEYRVLLQQGAILEYINGSEGAEEEALGEETPWYAVHPLVRELQRFKAAGLKAQAL